MPAEPPQKLTVLQMLPDLDSGGVERGTLEMGRYLVEQGHTSLVVSNGGRLVRRLEEEESIHFTMPVGVKSPRCLPTILSIRRLLINHRVDILHLRSRVPAWIGFLAVKSMPEKLRPRIVTTFHGFYSVNRYSAIMTVGERIIAVSKVIKDHIIDRYQVPEKMITVIQRGVDPSFHLEEISEERVDNLRQQWGIDNDSPVILLPGRITRLKGHDIFIEALADIKTLNWTAVCIGDREENPAYVDELLRLAEKRGLDNKRIIFTGYCDDMPAAYLCADLVVSATSLRPEAFGRIAIEAQAMQRPVIASAHGGSLETILPGKTGWLVETGCIDDLARAIGEALGDPQQRKTFGRNGCEWVRQNFSTEKMCRRTLSLYLDLMSE